MSAESTIKAEVIKAVATSDDLIDNVIFNNKIKSSYISKLKTILAKNPNVSTAYTAAKDLDWYEQNYQYLVNALASGAIPKGTDDAGRIAQANQAIEWAYKHIAAAGIDIKKYGSVGPSQG